MVKQLLGGDVAIEFRALQDTVNDEFGKEPFPIIRHRLFAVIIVLAHELE